MQRKVQMVSHRRERILQYRSVRYVCTGKPLEEVVHTRTGICLQPSEYDRLKELLNEIGNALPKWSAKVLCFLQSDRLNQLVSLQCPERNPNDYNN